MHREALWADMKGKVCLNVECQHTIFEIPIIHFVLCKLENLEGNLNMHEKIEQKPERKKNHFQIPHHMWPPSSYAIQAIEWVSSTQCCCELLLFWLTFFARLFGVCGDTYSLDPTFPKCIKDSSVIMPFGHALALAEVFP